MPCQRGFFAITSGAGSVREREGERESEGGRGRERAGERERKRAEPRRAEPRRAPHRAAPRSSAGRRCRRPAPGTRTAALTWWVPGPDAIRAARLSRAVPLKSSGAAGCLFFPVGDLNAPEPFASGYELRGGVGYRKVKIPNVLLPLKTIINFNKLLHFRPIKVVNHYSLRVGGGVPGKTKARSPWKR